MSVPADFILDYFGIVHGGHYDRYAEAGARWCRTDFPVWRAIEPGAAFSFDAWDREFQAAIDRGVTMLPLLGVNYTPPWSNAEGVHAFPPRSIEDVRRAVEPVVARYSRPPFNTRIFEVSNEPNIGWFWRTRDLAEAHKEYTDKVLIPTAEIIRGYGCKVVAPSITLEWPDNCWPGRPTPEDPERGPIPRKCHNVRWCIQALEDWLTYHDAWKHIDYFGLHYTKGDTDKPMLPFAENLMPIYDYLYDNWVKPGRILGIWNTEEGLTGVEAGNLGEVSLEPWEVAPYGQWVPRYTVPVIHWAIRKGWQEKEQYKCFWYNIRSGGALQPTSILGPTGEMAACGRAMGVLARLFEGAETVGVHEGAVEVGFGLRPKDPAAINCFAPYRFATYAFRTDEAILVVAWMDLPGLDSEGAPIEARLAGVGPVAGASRIDHLSGEEQPLPFARDGDELSIELPRRPDPIIYLKMVTSR